MSVTGQQNKGGGGVIFLRFSPGDDGTTQASVEELEAGVKHMEDPVTCVKHFLKWTRQDQVVDQRSFIILTAGSVPETSCWSQSTTVWLSLQ